MLALAGYGAPPRGLTHGFQVWTAEGARRFLSSPCNPPVPAPAVAIDGPGIRSPGLLPQQLADEGSPSRWWISSTHVARASAWPWAAASSSCSYSGRCRRRGGKVRLLSISFDPDRDDAGALAAYASRLGADPRVWRFARTAEAADTRTVLDRFQVTVIADGLGGYDHNAALLVMDAGGRLIRVFDYAEMETALAFARSLPASGGAR